MPSGGEGMTIKDALFEHQLDVASLEIESPERQLANLEHWMARVGAAQKPDADLLLAVTRKKVRKEVISKAELAAVRSIFERSEDK